MHSVLLFFGAFMLSGLLYGLCGHLALSAWRRSVGEHWTERARILWPARMDMKAAVSLCPLVALVAAFAVYGTPEMPWITAWAGGLCGALLSTFTFEHAVEPRLRFGPWLESLLWGAAIQLVSYGIVIALMITLPRHLGPGDWALLLGGSAIFIVVKVGLLLPILALFGKPKSLDPRVHDVVMRCQEVFGVKVSRAGVIHTPMANAFAVPLTRDVIVTSRLLEILNDAELDTVMRHEFAHLLEPRRVIVGRCLNAIAWLPVVLIHPSVGWLGPSGPFVVFLAPLFLLKAGAKLAQRMEVRADNMVLESLGNPADYASALSKLHEANQMPVVMPGQNSVHGHLYDRILATGLTPDYPRPQPPAKGGRLGWALLTLLVAVGIAGLIRYAYRVIG